MKRIVYKGFVTVWKDDNDYEVVGVTDSVAGLVYLTDLDAIVLVRQYRPPMVGEDNPSGQTVEVPAGRIDLPLEINRVMAKELLEEIGARVAPENLVILNGGKPLALAAGFTTERTHLFYAEITSKDLLPGNIFGEEGTTEQTLRLFIPRSGLQALVYDTMTTFALVQWFMNFYRKDE